MSKALILAEHDAAGLNPSTAKCVSCAVTLGADAVEIVVFAADAGVPQRHPDGAMSGQLLGLRETGTVSQELRDGRVPAGRVKVDDAVLRPVRNAYPLQVLLDHEPRLSVS